MTSTVRWGIMGCGGIASQFVKDALADPAHRDVKDVKHVIAAIGSSSSTDKAKKFAQDCGVPSDCHLYGSYKELLGDKSVECMYIATPHSHHYQNALDCLNAGHNVLCEKPLTVNAAQSKHLIQLAKEKNLFFMEAVWTRLFPLTKRLREMIFKEDVIGHVNRAFVDFSFDWNPSQLDRTNRAMNPDLAGGALLDLGPYPMVWAFMLGHDNPKNPSPNKGPEVASSITMSPYTPVDESTFWTLKWPELRTTVNCSVSMLNQTPSEFARIEGTKGFIIVSGHAARPLSFTVYSNDGNTKPAKYEFPIGNGQSHAQGLFWEADEAARCLNKSSKESNWMTMQESQIVMEVFDKIRQQNNFTLPASIEKAQ